MTIYLSTGDNTTREAVNAAYELIANASSQLEALALAEADMATDPSFSSMADKLHEVLHALENIEFKQGA